MASAVFGAGCIVGIPIWALWRTVQDRPSRDTTGADYYPDDWFNPNQT